MSNDLPKLALEVSAVWSPPERRAIGLADVRIAKLVRAAAEHQCTPVSTGFAPYAVLQAVLPVEEQNSDLPEGWKQTEAVRAHIAKSLERRDAKVRAAALREAIDELEAAFLLDEDISAVDVLRAIMGPGKAKR